MVDKSRRQHDSIDPVIADMLASDRRATKQIVVNLILLFTLCFISWLFAPLLTEARLNYRTSGRRIVAME